MNFVELMKYVRDNIKLNTALLINEETFDLGELEYHFTKIDSSDDTIDAQLIRAGVWDSNEVGIFWTEYNNCKIILAKRNPKEERQLIAGHMTNNKVYITDKPIIRRIISC